MKTRRSRKPSPHVSRARRRVAEPEPLRIVSFKIIQEKGRGANIDPQRFLKALPRSRGKTGRHGFAMEVRDDTLVPHVRAGDVVIVGVAPPREGFPAAVKIRGGAWMLRLWRPVAGSENVLVDLEAGDASRIRAYKDCVDAREILLIVAVWHPSAEEVDTMNRCGLLKKRDGRLELATA